jgi:hypothetical protein
MTCRGLASPQNGCKKDDASAAELEPQPASRSPHARYIAFAIFFYVNHVPGPEVGGGGDPAKAADAYG